jgi:hypothetical protein
MAYINNVYLTRSIVKLIRREIDALLGYVKAKTECKPSEDLIQRIGSISYHENRLSAWMFHCFLVENSEIVLSMICDTIKMFYPHVRFQE